MVTSASQLAVLAGQLDGCVTWEQSPTKVVREGGMDRQTETDRQIESGERIASETEYNSVLHP